MRLVSPLLSATALVLLLWPSPAARSAPTDVVPRGDIAYDLLGSLAGANLVPGRTLADFARGDRLYTRAEIAALVAQIRAAHPEIAGNRALGLSVLERAFAPELRAAPGATPRGPGLLAGSYKLRGVTGDGPDQAIHVGRLAGFLPVGRDGFAALSVGSYRYDGFEAGPGRSYPAIESAFVRVDGRFLDVTVGLQPLRWGPGYSGPLFLSDAAPAVPHIQVEKGFRLPGTLGRRIGGLYFTQFAGQFFEEEDPSAASNARGTRRFLLGRRLETRSDGRWNLSLAEGFKSTRLPDPWFALVLPFYTYQNDWTRTNHPRLFGFLASDAQPNTFWLNYLGSAGLSYRADGRGTTLYGDLLVDDTEAPAGLGAGDDVPSKTGYQLGVYAPNLGGLGGRIAARLEFSSIAATTFTNVSRPIEWDNDDLPLGFPGGPNARRLFARVDARLTDKFSAAVDGTVQRRTSGGEPGAEVDALGLYATYALRPNAFVGLRLDHRRVETFTQPEQTRTRFEVNAGIGF